MRFRVWGLEMGGESLEFAVWSFDLGALDLGLTNYSQVVKIDCLNALGGELLGFPDFLTW